MKLRNKKTGEIIDGGDYLNVYDDLDNHQGKSWHYNSLAELNEEWEDYEPVEPLIKDEKTRKAIRMWAEANEYDFDKGLDYTDYDGGYGCSFMTYGSDDNEIHFCKKLGLEDGRDYTIAELCGEDECSD